MNYLKLSFFAIIAVLSIACTKSDDNNQTTFPIGKVETRLGNMHFWLYDETPNHKEKFIELAKEKYYNDFSFNRVVKNFVIQGGCPDEPAYFEGSPYLLEPEFVDGIGHVYGALGMGRDDNPDKLSNACQFYIVNKEQGLPNLDNNYMIFGIIIDGIDVLEAIENEDTDFNDVPDIMIPLQVSIEYLTAEQLSTNFAFEIPE